MSEATELNTLDYINEMWGTDYEGFADIPQNMLLITYISLLMDKLDMDGVCMSGKRDD